MYVICNSEINGLTIDKSYLVLEKGETLLIGLYYLIQNDNGELLKYSHNEFREKWHIVKTFFNRNSYDKNIIKFYQDDEAGIIIKCYNDGDIDAGETNLYSLTIIDAYRTPSADILTGSELINLLNKRYNLNLTYGKYNRIIENRY